MTSISREERVAALAEHLCARRPCGDTPENVADWLTYSLQRCGLTLSPDVSQSEGWQPIETAPKDGRFVLLHCPNGQLESGDVTIGAYWKEDERAENGRFRKGHWDGWLGMDVDIASSWCDPTHWRPLPEPPLSNTPEKGESDG